jgi:hypothetical protein
MNEHIERGQNEQHDVPDPVRPRRLLSADRPTAEKIDQSEYRGENTEDHADAHEPRGKIRPHHLRRPPIGQVSQKNADEAGDWNRHEHRMDGLPEDPRCGPRVCKRQRMLSIGALDADIPEQQRTTMVPALAGQ